MSFILRALLFAFALPLSAAGPLTIETRISSVLPDLLATDSAGNIYVGEQAVQRVRRIDPGGALTPYAGGGSFDINNGPAGPSGVNLPSLSTVFPTLSAMASDSAGNVFLFDGYGCRLYRATSAGLVSTVAGRGGPGGSPDGTAALTASLWISGKAMAVSPAGVVHFYDASYNKVRTLTPGGVLGTVAGNGATSFTAPPTAVNALTAPMPSVRLMTFDGAGNLYLYSDYGTGNLFLLQSGLIHLVPGGQNIGAVTGLTAHPTRGLCYSTASAIRCLASGVPSLIAGSLTQSGYAGEGGPAVSALFNDIRSLASDPFGNLIVGDYANARVRRIPPSGLVETVASGTPQLANPTGVAVDAAGNLFYADRQVSVVRKVAPDGSASTLAGIGVPAFGGGSGPAVNWPLYAPAALAVDRDGNVFVADSSNHRLLEIAPNGIISGSWAFEYPSSVMTTPDRKVYFTDVNAVLQALPSGAAQLVAGDPYSNTWVFGDGGPPLAAGIGYAQGIAIDAAGNFYVAGTHRVRRFSPGGNIVTVAGNGACGDTGDGGLAVNAMLCTPRGLAIDANGNLFIADSGNRKVRRIDANGYISTYVGTGDAGYGGDGAAANLATLNTPWGLTFDSAGALLIADQGAAAVRRVLPGATCTLITNAWMREVSVSGGTGSIGINASPSNCSRTATSDAPWLRIVSGGTGTGSAVLNYAVDANPDFPARTARITIASEGSSVSFRVYQSGTSCVSYEFYPSTQTLTDAATGGLASISGTSYCIGGAPSTSDSWLSVGRWQLGAGQVSFAVLNNPLPTSRTATITLARATLTVTQPASPLAITAPTPGSALTSRTVTFTWTSPPAATGYRYRFGTSPGAGDIAAAETAANSVTLGNLPDTGQIHAAVWYRNSSSNWQPVPVTATYPVQFPAEVQAVSVSPASGAGRQQTFSFAFSDSAGADRLSVAWVWIASNFTPGDGSAACLLYYLPESNGIFLLGDGATGPWLGPLTPGAAGSVGNSRCSIDGPASSAGKNGVTLTLNLAISFKPAFNGVKNIYAYAADKEGSNSGWQTKGTWTVSDPAPVTPVVTAVSVTPASGSGASQTFAFKYSDTLGAADLSALWIWFGPFTPGDGSKSCILLYLPQARELHLLDSAGTAWSNPGTPGSPGSLSNTRCSLSLPASSVATSGNDLTLNLAMNFVQGKWTGVPIQMYGAGSTVNSGWKKMGDWTVPQPDLYIRSATSSSPSGAEQTFTVIVDDIYGSSDLTEAQLWLEAAPAPTDPSKACILRYSKSDNSIALRNNAGTAWSSAMTRGSGFVLRNRRCTVNLAASTLTTDSGSLTWGVDISFTSDFIGAINIFAYGVGVHGNTGWPTMGSFTVPSSAPAPAAIAIQAFTPSSGTGLQATFTTLYTDSGGTTALSEAWWWIAESFTPGDGTSGCIFRYHRPSNTLYLIDDAGTAWTSGAMPGSATTISNSRCSIVGAQSRFSVLGTDLRLEVAVTFASSFSGDKQVYGYAAGTGVDGWKKLGTWTVPAPAAPQVSVLPVAPASGSASSQNFQFSFLNSQGADRTTDVWVWFGPFTPGDGTKSCILRYDSPSNSVYLLNDAGTAWSSGAAPGSGTTLANSRCSVALATAAVTRSLQTLTLTLPMTFTGAFAGAQTISAYAAGAGASSGWKSVGTWTVPAPAAGAVTIAGPVSGYGSRSGVSVTASSSSGVSDLSEVWVWVAAAFTPGNGTNACIFRYNRADNLVYLLNDAGDAWTSGRPTALTSIENSRCSLNLAGTGVWTNNGLVLNLWIFYKPAFAGEKVVYAYASGQASNSGWKQVGSVTAIGDTTSPVRLESFQANPFHLTVYDKAGVADLNDIWVWIASEFTPGDGSNACIFRRAPEGWYLLNANGAGWTGPVTNLSLSNGRCSVVAAAAPAINELLLIPQLTFTNFSGVKKVFAYVGGNAGVTGWKQVGTITVP